MENYNYYLNQTNCLTIHEIDDVDGFHKLMDALHNLEISKDDQERIFKMFAVILWLGNISFQVIGNENNIEVLDDEAITNAASLLGCDVSDLTLALSTHKNQVGQNLVAKQLSLQQEYELDGIDGIKVDFVDNQECLDLFEKVGNLLILDQSHLMRSLYFFMIARLF